MKSISIIAFLLASMSAISCDELQKHSMGPPVIRVDETVDYDARAAGFASGDLRATVEEALREEGVQVVTPGEQPNIIVSVQLQIMDIGMDAYTGMVMLTVKEPATLWSTGQNVQTMTTFRTFVFTQRKTKVREQVHGRMVDAVREVVRENRRLISTPGST
jgi:hypothetical protein